MRRSLGVRFEILLPLVSLECNVVALPQHRSCSDQGVVLSPTVPNCFQGAGSLSDRRACDVSTRPALRPEALVNGTKVRNGFTYARAVSESPATMRPYAGECGRDLVVSHRCLGTRWGQVVRLSSDG